MEKKDCPFCGRDQAVSARGSRTSWWVMCETCHAEGPTGSNEDDAIEKWNKRLVSKEAVR